MMHIEEVRNIALSLPNTEKKEHWGKASFRINNKIFAVIQPDMKTITVKITKEERELYTATNPETYSTPDSFANVNYMHINLESANREEVIDLINSAWAMVAPKKLSNTYLNRR